jgi:hypothetical protein
VNKNLHVFFEPHYEAKHELLREVLGQVIAELRQEWRGLIEKRIADLVVTPRERRNTANDKINEGIAAL